MKRGTRNIFFSITILGMLMLAVSSGIFVNPTPISVQNPEVSPVSLYATAENNVLLWYTTWGGTDTEQGFGVAVDANGSIYCVGHTVSFGVGSNDLALVKFAPNGTRLWNVTWGGVYSEDGRGVVIDADGAVYCSGSTLSFGAGSNDLALVKFAPNGTRLWNTTWGGTGTEQGFGEAVGPNGSIYCTGSTISFGVGNEDLMLVKFAPNGTRLWNVTWGGVNSEIGRGVAIDADGAVYCSGYTDSFGAGSKDLALVKFAPNGMKLWNTTWGGLDWDVSMDIAIDAMGDLYLVGITQSYGAGSYDFALVKFAPNGTKLWNVTWGGADFEQGYSVAVDASGAAYCTGITYNSETNQGVALVKFAPNGVNLWNYTWDSVLDEAGVDIVMDAAGNIYCSGYAMISGKGLDFVLLKFGYPSKTGGIPGFELIYLVFGFFALISLVQRRRFY